METIEALLQYILHIDQYLISFVASYGIWTYVALFLIIFCETGLVITPFLPGDSLLFAAGSIAGSASEALSIQVLLILLIIASILGNKLNYLIGMAIGPKVFIPRKTTSNIWGRVFNRKYLEQAHQFYEEHGGKTIIIARFLPIIRTFAPFVAGVSYMSLRRFTVYNALSAVIWIGSLLGAGYFFGRLSFVQRHFSLFIYGIILLSILPPIITLIYKRYFTAQSTPYVANEKIKNQ